MSSLEVETTDYERKVLQTLRFFVAIVFSGVLLFLPIVYVAIPATDSASQPGEPDVLTVLVGVVAALCLILAVYVPRRIAAAARGRVLDGSWREDPSDLADSSIPAPGNESEYLASTFNTLTLTQAVLLGAPAFFASVVYMVHREKWLLGVGVVMLALIVTRFPTRARLLQWVESQLGLIGAARS